MGNTKLGDDSIMMDIDWRNPVIEEYKKHVDVTLLLENLKLTPVERLRRLDQMVIDVKRLRDSASRSKGGGRDA